MKTIQASQPKMACREEKGINILFRISFRAVLYAIMMWLFMTVLIQNGWAQENHFDYGNAQVNSLSKTRFVIGLSAPELLHTGINLELTKSSQLGISAGIGPTWGGTWPTLNIEHRLYFGALSELTNRRKLFFKQGATYFTAADQQTALTFTLGADLKSKSANKGWTIDFGVFVLFVKSSYEKTNSLYPALRFQYYSFFTKTKTSTH